MPVQHHAPAGGPTSNRRPHTSPGRSPGGPATALVVKDNHTGADGSLGGRRPESTPARNTVAERALDVLLLFDEREPVLSVAEITRRLGMPRTTTYRYLHTLRSYGLIEPDDLRGGIRLGTGLIRLARIARQGLGLCEIALPAMRDLAKETGEAVLLTRRSGNQVVCIERVESEHPIRLSYERGHALPIHAGASAKIILAFSEPAEIDELLAGVGALPRYTPRTVTGPAELRAQLAQIRSQGYTITRGEVTAGVRAVAAPILHPDGRVAAGLTVAGPETRLDDDRLPALVDAVRAAAARISGRLAEITA